MKISIFFLGITAFISSMAFADSNETQKTDKNKGFYSSSAGTTSQQSGTIRSSAKSSVGNTDGAVSGQGRNPEDSGDEVYKPNHQDRSND